MGQEQIPPDVLGLLCPNCDALNPLGRDSCGSCGGSVEPDAELRAAVEKIDPSIYKGLSASDPGPDTNVAGPRAEQEKEPPMEQAQHYVCTSCYTPVPLGHKFCGKCGAPTPFVEEGAQVKYYGAMQVPGKARLILIKGDDEMDGISYHLNADQHIVGRSEGVILFSSDAWVAPKHANFYYRDSALFVRDEGTDNGVYIRIREPVSLSHGDSFAVGEQVFRFDGPVDATDQPDSDGTYFFHSPWENKSFRVIQVLEGGGEGMQVHDKEGELTIGRDDCDMNFYDDEYMSLKHVKIASVGQKYELEDLGSKNGTFLKLKGEQKLEHGDYVMIGKELLRVEIV
jgi:pSer/pThr/pTyr-binding forkhead associated (FHA) protein/ribosomal protein L40E